MTKELEIMIEAAEAGGKIVKKYFGRAVEISEKSIAADVRTKADLESEEAVLEILEKAFSSYNIFAEEGGLIDKKSEYTFIIDPLDGTNNFVLGIPHLSVAIALMKGDTILASVIHNPLLSPTYSAQKGHGSFLNGEKIAVNKENNIERATISYTCPYSTTPKEKAVIAENVYGMSPKRMLTMWSPLLDFCLLGAGKIEGTVSTIPNLYDFIPGKLIASEAGAKITGLKGEKISDKDHIFVASNGTEIHEKIIEAFR
jgi:myo-inositol-1(or 4)-monophosphatase